MSMVRQTKQRTAVIAVLQHTDVHPDAAWIHSRVREQLPQVSLGTVYRTLDALVQEGLVFTLERTGHATRYDYRRSELPHQHAVCSKCDAIFDVVLPKLPAVPPQALPAGFELTSVQVELVGVCLACQAKENRAS